MSASELGTRSDVVTQAIRDYNREARRHALTQEQADELLAEIRELSRKLRYGSPFPKGVRASGDVAALIDHIDRLDRGLTAKSPLPSDWTDHEN